MQQNQDLNVYSNHRILPNTSDKNHSSIYSILYNNGTYPLWLINKFINEDSNSSEYKFTVSSFINNNKFMKQNITQNVGNTSKIDIEYVDMTLGLQTTSLPKLVDAKYKHISSKEGRILILEQPELLISSLEGMTSISLYNDFINKLQNEKFQHIIIISNIDYYNHYINSFLQYQYTTFFQSLQYKSDVIFTVKSLKTGFAKDISGTLTITKGGAFDISKHANDVKIVENEYFFYVVKDNVVKLFY